MLAIETQFTDDEKALLSSVPEDGCALGNKRLRNILGWDEQKYVQVKKSLLDKGVLQPGRGMGGSVKRIVTSLANSRRTSERQKAETDIPNREEPSAITRKQRAKLTKILFNSIPRDGQTLPNHVVLGKVQEAAKKQLNLDVPRELYFEIRNELIAAGQAGKGVGFGGSVYRINGIKKAAKRVTPGGERGLYGRVYEYIKQS